MENTKITIEKACEGLFMMSESDHPFEYFSTSESTLNEELIVKLSGKPSGTPVEIIEIDYLFRNMIKVYPESTDAEKILAERFKELVNILKTALSGLKVYRLGQVQVDVFIAGIMKSGTIAGLKTKLIET